MRRKLFPILDDHFHLDPRGKRWKAVGEFERSGGTHIILVSKPYYSYPYKNIEIYQRIYETTVRLAKEAMEKTGVRIYVAVGPHPADFTENLRRGVPFREAVELMKSAIDLAAKYVENGNAIAIGEVGRPHYPVSKKIWAASNEIMLYAMEVAKDLDCPVILHTETATPKVFREISNMAKKAGLRAEKVVKHFSPPAIFETENFGLIPSVISMDLALREAIAKARRSGRGFMMETDYLDDPNRPGSVLGPKTVPRKTYNFFEEGIMDEELIYLIHKNTPEKVYNIEVELE